MNYTQIVELNRCREVWSESECLILFIADMDEYDYNDGLIIHLYNEKIKALL